MKKYKIWKYAYAKKYENLRMIGIWKHAYGQNMKSISKQANNVFKI